MTIRHKTFLLANALSALAADLKLRPPVRSADTSDYDRTLPAAKSKMLAEKKAAPNTRGVTGTIESPAKARVSLTPVDTSDYDRTPSAAKSKMLAEKKTAPNTHEVTGTIESPAGARVSLTPADTSDYDRTLPAAKSKILAEKKAGTATRDVTGTIEWPASARASLTPATAAISHTYSARASFAKARSAMESGILLREDVPKPNFASLEAATGDVLSELKALELVTQHRSDEAIRKAMALVQDWYDAGLKIIKPPPQGVTALPFPSTVAAKANAVSAALDQLIEQANAAVAPNRSVQRSDVQIKSPGSIPAAPSRVRVPPANQ
jgi:hypothetical protein